MVAEPATKQQAGLGGEGQHGAEVRLIAPHPLPQGGRRCGADEGEQHELAETAAAMLPGPLLQGHQCEQMGSAVGNAFQMAGHQRGGAGQASFMHLQDHGTPLAGGELLRAETLPQRFAQHLGGGTGHGVEPGAAEGLQHRLKAELILLGDEQQLLRREGVQMQPWCGLSQALQQLHVIRERRTIDPGGCVQAPLDAEFGGPERLGFSSALLQGVKAVPVGARLAWIAAKGTEAAVLLAMVAGVEVAVHHVGDRVAHQLAAQVVGLTAQRLRRRLTEQPQGQSRASAAGRIVVQGGGKAHLLGIRPSGGGFNSLSRWDLASQILSGGHQQHACFLPGPGFKGRRARAHRRERPEDAETGC